MTSSASLYSTFATPFFAPGQSAPTVQPDFTLPAAYRVTNVPPLAAKISEMSYEGLMAVFYSMPRDVAQELAAQELYSKEWRWHVREQIWLRKDPSLPAPRQTNSQQEHGTYLVFNIHAWRTEPVSLLLMPRGIWCERALIKACRGK
jgi:CCR4-NOT transcription complex subunit 2